MGQTRHKGALKDEHLAYGIPFLKPSQKVECLNESVEIIKQLWTQENVTYAGKHYQIADAECEPKPIQKPNPPLIIGGGGEKYTLKVTAQHADRFDFGFISDIVQYKHKLQVLESYCKTVGRDFEEIEKSCWPAGQIVPRANPKLQQVQPANMLQKFELESSFEACLSKLQDCLDLGVTYFMLFFADLPDTTSLRLFAKTVGKKT